MFRTAVGLRRDDESARRSLPEVCFHGNDGKLLAVPSERG
jgi:hypothetical protein